MSNQLLDNNKRIAKNAIFLYGRLILTMLISLYTTRVVLNVLGVVDFGIYNVICGFVAMFSFLNTTMSNGIQRFYNYEAGKNGLESVTKVYQTAMLIQFLLVIGIVFIVEPLGIWYINNKMVLPEERLFAANWVFQCSLLSLVLLVIQVPFSASVMAHEKMNYYASVGILDAFLKLAIVIVLPFLGGDSLIIYGILLFSVSVINLLLYSVYALRNFSELKFERIFHKNLFCRIFKFSSWNLVEMFAWTTQIQGVNMVMNLFCGPVANAAQGIASQISSALSSFCSNISIAFRPQLVHSYAVGNYLRTTNMMFTMSKAMFVMMALMVIPLSLEMNFVLKIWLGNNVPKYTLQFAVLVIFSMLPRNMIMPLSQVIHASGKMKNYQLGSAIVVLLALPISYLLLKMGYSPVNIYICNILIFILLWIVDVLLLHKVFSFSVSKYIRTIVLPCILTLTLSFFPPYVIHSHLQEGFMRFVVVTITCTATVTVFSFLIIIKNKEKQILLDIVLKKINKRKI